MFAKRLFIHRLPSVFCNSPVTKFPDFSANASIFHFTVLWWLWWLVQEDELSEQQIRIGLIEKRLDNATKDADDRVDKIQQKLDEASFELKRKEK